MAGPLLILVASAARILSVQLEYPPRSLVANEQGAVSFKVEVLASGKARNCRVTSGSGFAALDKATCDQILTRAIFEPAADANGRAIDSTLEGSMNWTIPPRAKPGSEAVRPPVG